MCWRVCSSAVGRGWRCIFIGKLFGNQCFQRICCLRRIQVEHQPVLIRRNRRQREHLRQYGPLEVNHQPHNAGRVLSNPDALNVRVVRLDLGDELTQGRDEVNAFNVHGQARRLRHKELPGLDLAIRFNGQACVVF